MNKVLIIIIIIILYGQFFSCAKMVFPTGGEGDIKSPTISVVYPENKSLNINPKTKIQIKFSEWVDPKSIKNAIFISPQIEFDVKVNTRNIEITPKTPFLENTSYHISFLGDITDFSGNPLVETKTIIFSTGDFIDTSNVSGKIFFENTDSILPKVALFFEERVAEHDTILLTMPDYITQADSTGFFSFDNISQTRYRAIGFLDQNKDNRITPLETVFLGENQIVETGNLYELFPATSDTTQNRIGTISAISPTILSMNLKFTTENKPFDDMRITNAENENIRFEKTEYLDDNQTIAVWLQDSLQNRQYSLVTKAQRIVANIEDSVFYDTVLFNGTTLTDSINLAKLDSLLGNYIPKEEIADTSDTNFIDTTEQIVLSPKLSWNFHGELPANPLWELRNEGEFSIFTTDNFVDSIPIGKYTIFLIDDRNQNKKFDTGTLFPFVAGEKRIAFSDILNARERWEAEYDIVLPLPKIPQDSTETVNEQDY